MRMCTRGRAAPSTRAIAMSAADAPAAPASDVKRDKRDDVTHDRPIYVPRNKRLAAAYAAARFKQSLILGSQTFIDDIMAAAPNPYGRCLWSYAFDEPRDILVRAAPAAACIPLDVFVARKLAKELRIEHVPDELHTYDPREAFVVLLTIAAGAKHRPHTEVFVVDRLAHRVGDVEIARAIRNAETSEDLELSGTEQQLFLSPQVGACAECGLAVPRADMVECAACGTVVCCSGEHLARYYSSTHHAHCKRLADTRLMWRVARGVAAQCRKIDEGKQAV